MTLHSRTVAFTAAAAAAGLLLTACSTADTRPAPGKAGSGSDADPGTGHLHGLGVDPADGTLYAAGHLGVFRLTPAGAVRIADRRQDTMGFTVTGPRTFLASGHPSPDDPAATSPHLGLIRSTDAGATWSTVSGAGEADFHSLQQAGPLLYGLDSQTSKVWASTDGGATWERRAKIRPVTSPPTRGRRMRCGRPGPAGCCTAPTAVPRSGRFPARRPWPPWSSRLPAGCSPWRWTAGSSPVATGTPGANRGGFPAAPRGPC
ncbi:WD40/YVTN/BNR-like repeat-containing protein [Streptomyces sp. NRRL F-4474]|uniref:WD40/YVTN/BNR-like repeat-containing protein n=1 Tax=Streptomyces sp. NRRL F-4474 TaxID=1463851 RepID=UPI000689A6EF|nr:hypothetical protein [Streptomyces sp. NRRL F-4474]